MPLGDQFDWALNSGTTGTLKTGPTEDHTGYKGKIIIPVLLLLLLLFLFCFCFVFFLFFFQQSMLLYTHYTCLSSLAMPLVLCAISSPEITAV